MRYSVLTSSDASIYLQAKRSGNPIDLDRLSKTRGEGTDLSTEFVNDLIPALAELRRKYPDASKKGAASANLFEAEAAKVIHERIVAPPEILADPDFWLWVAVRHFGDTIEWRYGSPAAGTHLSNYGIGSRSENLMFRLWLRAELVLDERASDRYHLCRRGQIDFYRSHLFRQGYANVRNFARALLRFQYPNDDVTSPYLKVDQIRELVKRLRRLRANLFLEILEEEECREVIDGEAETVVISV
jgi:hypothetical protein